MFYLQIILFFIYSFLGWLMEVGLTFIREKRFINRGFLIGPCCPIYGVGCFLLNLLLKNYTQYVLVLFVLTFSICSILEYFTSYLMEKTFKLRWWDYSQLKYNLNGRICLETMIPFSIIGLIVIKYLNPFLMSILSKISNNVLLIIAVTLVFMFLADLIISCNVIFNIKNITNNIRKDSTEDIKKAISKFISNHTYVYDRMIKAFPNMKKIIKDKATQTKQILKKSFKKI